MEGCVTLNAAPQFSQNASPGNTCAAQTEQVTAAAVGIG
jgi:hypothetical protein